MGGGPGQLHRPNARRNGWSRGESGRAVVWRRLAAALSAGRKLRYTVGRNFTFRVEATDREVAAGTMAYVDGNVEHALRASEDSSLLVTILLKPKQ